MYVMLLIRYHFIHLHIATRSSGSSGMISNDQLRAARDGAPQVVRKPSGAPVRPDPAPTAHGHAVRSRLANRTALYRIRDLHWPVRCLRLMHSIGVEMSNLMRAAEQVFHRV